MDVFKKSSLSDSEGSGGRKMIKQLAFYFCKRAEAYKFMQVFSNMHAN